MEEPGGSSGPTEASGPKELHFVLQKCMFEVVTWRLAAEWRARVSPSMHFCRNLKSVYPYLREFVRTAVILTPACEASRVGTALCRQDPQDWLDPVECSFLREFETPIEVERSEAQI